jgi:LPS O-antigen subunit length determinant protein (WzzB/FepE family)
VEKYQARVIVEKAELDARLQKLNAFLAASPPRRAGTLGQEYDRLMKQSRIMTEYSAVLADRIAHFNCDADVEYPMKKSWKDLVIIVMILWGAMLGAAMVVNHYAKQETKPQGGCIYIETNQCFCQGIGDEGGTKG